MERYRIIFNSGKEIVFETTFKRKDMGRFLRESNNVIQGINYTSWLNIKDVSYIELLKDDKC